MHVKKHKVYVCDACNQGYDYKGGALACEKRHDHICTFGNKLTYKGSWGQAIEIYKSCENCLGRDVVKIQLTQKFLKGLFDAHKS